ncbi:MAG: efflux RND transporter periplasmic adaptor subunit, partial [Lachnospiraceae bacterium]|nr:efflux RND transporter periplasmic adaptor subunit [Lachnospiraceae bacterium]
MGNDPDIVDISSEITADNPSQTGPEKAKTEPVTAFRTKKNRKWIKWMIILAVIAGLIVFVVIKVRNAAEKLKDAVEPTQQEATVTRMDITSSISTTGTIQSKDVRTLTSALSGVKIEEVNYKVGNMVEQGAIVVTFSREDINKKIGQLEEDITEAKQAKALDGGDRTNTYVNGNDLENYGIATSYEAFQRAGEDLKKAKDDLQKACDDKAEYKAKYEEAKEKIDGAKDEYIEAKVKLDGIDPGDKDAYEKQAFKVSELQAKYNEYKSRIDGYDTGIDTYIKAEETAQKTVDQKERDYSDAYVKLNKSTYDASFNMAKNDYNLNKGNLTANDNVKSLERQKEQSEDSLDNYIVTAPISGLVTAVNAEEGNGYQATTGALMTIQAVDVLEVTTQVDEYDINNVKLGQDVVIMTDATGSDELKGVVTFVSPTATVASGTASSNTFEVKIDILNKDERLRLGMSAKLNIIMDTHKDVLA